MNSKRDILRRACALAALPLLRLAHAQDARSVRILTPFPAGSGPDASLRVLAEPLERRWHRPVVIDNRPGGNGFIAVAAFKQAPADGSEFIQLDNSHTTTHPHVFSKLPYDVQADFVPVAMLLRTPFFVAVGSGSRFGSLQDIVDAARAQPGRIKYGSWFNGSPGHIGGLLLQASQGIQMVHVPFRDFGQLYGAVANQDVDWALGSVASAGGLERAGKLRFVALAAGARDPLYPGVPAASEIPALRGYQVSGWTGLFGRRGLPADVRDRLNADVREVLRTREVEERYRALGFETPKLTSDEFAGLIRTETQAWGEIVRLAHLKLD